MTRAPGLSRLPSVARGRYPVRERLRIAPLALVERRLLLFCALVEAETALPLDLAVGALVDGGDEARRRS